MTVERIPITSRAQWLDARRHDVTASAAAALLGAHDYQTAYGLWALKSGRVAEDAEETAPMRRGRLLEPVAIQLLAEERPDWRVERGDSYYRDTAARLGATPDAFATCPERGLGIVQVKSVERSVFARKWRGEDGIEPPLGYVVQAIVEAHLTGAKWACVAALVVGFGLDLHVVEVPIHAGLIDRIRAEVAAFWALVESGEEPAPDYGRDGGIIASMAGPDDGSAIDLSGDNRLPGLLDEREEIKARSKDDAARLAAIDAEVRDKVGAASSALVGPWRLTLKTQETKAYAVAARTTRPIRVRRIVEKGEAA